MVLVTIARYFLHFKNGATQTGKCHCIHDPRASGTSGESSTEDPMWPTPIVCDVAEPSDVHVPLCDYAEPTKCNSKLYFDQNQCPMVPGNNFANNTNIVYQVRLTSPRLLCYRQQRTKCRT
jgi:hypothetical protein